MGRDCFDLKYFEVNGINLKFIKFLKHVRCKHLVLLGACSQRKKCFVHKPKVHTILTDIINLDCLYLIFNVSMSFTLKRSL